MPYALHVLAANIPAWLPGTRLLNAARVTLHVVARACRRPSGLRVSDAWLHEHAIAEGKHQHE